MLELKVASTDVTNGNIAVAWCLNKETLQDLAARHIQDPQVVICVAPTEHYHARREYRKVVPLKDLMTYLGFRSSGENRIWAFISDTSRKDTRNRFLARDSGEYSTSILNFDGDNWSTNHSAGKYVDGNWKITPRFPAEPVTVHVPTAAFAKEPPAWEKTWVNHWFRNKPQDQCDYRRRRLLAYTVQPIVTLLDVLVVRTIFCLVAALWLSRGLSFKYHRHPLRYSLFETAAITMGGSWAIPHLPEDDTSTEINLTVSYAFRKLWRLPLMPAVFIPVLVLWHFHALVYLAIGLGILAAAVLICCVVVSGFFTDLFKGVSLWWQARQVEPELWYTDEEEMQLITCGKSFKARTSVADLPSKHRSISLRFQDLKSKVCRPFSA